MWLVHCCAFFVGLVEVGKCYIPSSLVRCDSSLFLNVGETFVLTLNETRDPDDSGDTSYFRCARPSNLKIGLKFSLQFYYFCTETYRFCVLSPQISDGHV